MKPLFAILLFLRISLPAEAGSCRRDSELLTWERVPSCEGEDLRANGTWGPVRTNRLGLLAPDYPPRAAPGTFRVLFLGSSLGLDVRAGYGLGTALANALGGGKSKVELINASDNGVDRALLQLRIGALLEAYHPDAVILLEDFQAHALQQAYEYLYAKKTDDGHLLSLGYVNVMWPLPRDWNWLRRLPTGTAELASKWLKALHMASAQILISLGLWPYAHELDPSPYLDVHLRLFRDIRATVEAAGSQLWLVNLVPNDWDPAEIFRKHQKQKNAWYKPEHLVSSKILPWYHLSRDDLRRLDAWNRANARYADVSVSERVRGRFGELFEKKDLHLSDEGVRVMAEEAARLLSPWMTSAKPTPPAAKAR